MYCNGWRKQSPKWQVGGKGAAKEWQASGKGWQKTGKIAKFSLARLLHTGFTSRGDNQQSTNRQLEFLQPT